MHHLWYHKVADIEKLVKRILQRHKDITFQEVRNLLEAFGYHERTLHGKHPVFVKPGHPPITVPTVKGRHVKWPYIRKIVELLRLEEWYEEREGA